MSIDTFGECLKWIVSLYQEEFLIYGYSVSFWQVFLFCFIATIVIGVVVALFSSD